ncbi:MAG TPA: NAD(P)H-binding protein [Flavobacteriaceae bacterium]|nr:NAD(P)H-binding protein [Flavobacteriaceae bacterium]
MQKTAIILGATGLTGSHLLKLLLEDETFSKVVVFTRRETGIKHPKLEEHIIDLLQLDNYKELFKGDVVFCCIGTTKAKTPNKKAYKAIDYGIPVTAAKLAKQNNIDTYLVISAMGASETSKVFYNKLKGEMEREVLAQKIAHTYLLQPSLIVGERSEKRGGEKFAEVIMRTFGFLIPEKYKMIQGKTIAKAMVEIAKNGYDKGVITSGELQELGKTK